MTYSEMECMLSIAHAACHFYCFTEIGSLVYRYWNDRRTHFAFQLACDDRLCREVHASLGWTSVMS
jgi:hypothetical protein